MMIEDAPRGYLLLNHARTENQVLVKRDMIITIMDGACDAGGQIVKGSTIYMVSSQKVYVAEDMNEISEMLDG